MSFRPRIRSAIKATFLFCLAVFGRPVKSESSWKIAIDKSKTLAIGARVSNPVLSDGRLVDLLASPLDSSAAEILITDINSGLQQNITLRLRGARTIKLTDALPSSDGGTVAAGYATSSTNVVARFVARLGSKGEVTNLIRTNDYQASNICFAKDGEIWTLGTMHRTNASQDYRLLRRWNWAKGLVSAALPHDALPFELTSDDVRRASSYLECDNSGVTLLNTTHNLLLSFREDGIPLDTDYISNRDTQERRLTGIAYITRGQIYSSAISTSRKAGFYIGNASGQDAEAAEYAPGHFR